MLFTSYILLYTRKFGSITFSYYTVQRDQNVSAKGKKIYCQCEINYWQGVRRTSHLGSAFQCNFREQHQVNGGL